MKIWKNSTPQQWLEWLLPLYILLLPWQARFIIAPFSVDIPRYGDLSTYATDVLFVALVACWFFYLRRERSKPHGDWRRLRIVVALVLAFMTYAVVSSFWSPDYIASREQLFRISQGVLLAMMLASGAVSRWRLILALAVSGAIQGVWSVAQFLMQYIPASTVLGMAAQAPENLGVSVIEYADQRWLRAYGTLPHPNMLGVFCGAAMLASAYLYWHGYALLLPWKERFDQMGTGAMRHAAACTAFGWVCAIFCYLGLLLSFSRSAWLATAAAALVFVVGMVLYNDANSRRYVGIAAGKLAAVCALLMVFLSALFGPMWLQRTNDQTRLGQQSSSDRIVLEQQARELSSSASIIGHGIGSYMPALIEAQPEQPLYSYQPVHNSWRMMVVELGWVGGLLASGVMAALGWLLWRFKSVVGLSFSVFFLISSQFEHFWYSLPFGILLAATLIALPLAKEAETW